MNVIGCQLDIVWEDPPANFRRVQALLENSPPESGSLIVLPELFATGFSMAVEKIAEGAASATESFLAESARRWRCWVAGGVPKKTAGAKARNEAAVFSPAGDLVCRYAKLQPFTLGTEAVHYEAGSRIQIFQWRGLAVAPFICYDLRFPELFRTAALRGAQMFVVMSNWPAARIQHWITLLQARAIENQAYVIGVNRAGQDPTLIYPGRSLAVDPHGNILTDAGEKEGLLSAAIDPAAANDWRARFPALPDVRPECRAGLDVLR